MLWLGSTRFYRGAIELVARALTPQVGAKAELSMYVVRKCLGIAGIARKER